MRDGICSITPEQTLYAAGRSAVVHSAAPDDTERSQIFLSGSERGRFIRALAMSPNKRCVAIAEEGLARPQLVVYPEFTDPIHKKFKQLAMPPVGGSDATISKTYIALAFSRDTAPDYRYLAALSGAPDYMLHVWALDCAKMTNKLVGTPVRTIPPPAAAAGVAAGMPQGHQVQVLFSPNDPSALSMSGPSYFRLFSVREAQGLKGQKEPFSQKNLRVCAHAAGAAADVNW